MKRANPAIVPRNHLVESALLQATEKTSLSEFHHLLELTQAPFSYSKEQLACVPAPLEAEKNYRTYCGT